MSDNNTKGIEFIDFHISPKCCVALSADGKVFYTGFGSAYEMTEDSKVKDVVAIAVREDAYYSL